MGRLIDGYIYVAQVAIILFQVTPLFNFSHKLLKSFFLELLVYVELAFFY
jgi:hypothetical protein